VAKLARLKTILLEAESSYGTDPTPTAGSDAIQVRDLNVEPVVSDEVSRDLIRGYLGNYEVLLANTRVNVSFDVEMTGSGAAGTAPKYGAALKACGFSETVASGTSVTYAPVSASFGSCTIYANFDGVRHKVTGARGTCSFNCAVGEIPTISFNFTGIFNTITDTTMPTATISNQASPVLWNSTNTTSFSLFGFAANCQSWNLDVNNEIIYRELVGGTKEVLITDRKPSGTAVIEAEALSAHNYFTDATGTSTGTNTWAHSGGAGNIVTMSCPQTDLGQPTYSESDGIMMLNLPFMATPTTAGNNEISLVYT
tara:strand:- start:222 stop:1157 length:936 start_codon:yes stop_codon:yes gene_type:complete